MTKLIRLSNDVILELDKIRDNRLSYTQAIRELITRANNPSIIKQIQLVLEQLELIKDELRNKTNY